MKYKKLIPLFFILLFVLCKSDTSMQVNINYPNNRPPLLQTEYIKLPLGMVKPEGWLKDQLIIQTKGLTGYLDEFYLTDSRWKGGKDSNTVPGPKDAWALGYLNGLVTIAYILDDDRLKEKAQEYIEWIISSAQPNGWLGPPWEEGYEETTVSHPGYVLNAIGILMHFSEVVKDDRILPIAQNFMNFMKKNVREWPESTWWGMGAMGTANLAYWVYNKTGDPELIEYIEHVHKNTFDWTSHFLDYPWDTEALVNNKIPHNWSREGKSAHIVLNCSALSIPAIWYLQSKDEKSKNAVYSGIASLEKFHGQVGGRFSGDEHVAGRRPSRGSELCGIIALMSSMENLFGIFGDSAFMDRLEFLAFNGLPGTITPDFWAHQYDQQANQVLVSNAKREWSTNASCANIYGLSPNYPCCLITMHRGFPEYVEHMWMASQDNGLVAAAYGPCKVTAKVADGVEVTIFEETEYPFDGIVRFTIELTKPCRFPLYLRIPQWASGASLKSGSKTIMPEPGRLHRLERKWKSGDVIELHLPLDIRTETRYNKSVAIKRGPLYFSLRIGKEFRKLSVNKILSGDKNVGDAYCIDSRSGFMGAEDWEIWPTTSWNYGLDIDRENPENSVRLRRNKIGRFPWADKGDLVYMQEENGFKTWLEDPPVILYVKGKRIPEWKLRLNSADDPLKSPVRSGEPVEELVLVPYGSARLRISEFPTLTNK